MQSGISHLAALEATEVAELYDLAPPDPASDLANEERFSAFLSATSDVVYRMSATWGEMRYLQGRHFIADTDEPNGSWLDKYIPQDEQPRVVEAIREAIRTKSMFRLEHRVRRVDGSIGWTFSRAVPIKDRAGNLIEWVGAASDITEAKLAEEALHRGRAWLAGQKEAFQSAVNGASLDVSLGILIRTAIEQTEGDPRCAFYIADSRGQVLNHVTGMSDEFARCVANFRIGLDSIACGLAVASGQPVITADVVEDPLWKDWLWLARDHGYRACWSFPVETGTGKIVGSFAVYFPKPRQPTARDRELAAALTQSAAIIISRYQESEDLARARRALEANDRQKDEFLAMLAHELRNPLAAVSTAGELLSRTLNDNPRARVAIDVIRRQAGQLTRLVDDLLDIQRIAQGPITLQRRPIALSSIIEQAVETVEQQLVQKQQQLWVLDSEVPVYVYGDFARLMQCVVNVLTNAAKYTDAHGHIRIATRVADSSAIIEVSDTGVGIAAEVLPHVFDLFVQSHRTLDRAQGGLGIGLSVVRRLIEMHGGQVAARSPGLGLGSTFELRLPCIPPPLTSPSAEAFRAPPRRVLIVDDNADAANSLAMLLSQGNHEIEVAYSAQEALARVESFRPDVALLDIGLPEIDGYELARRLRTMPQLTGVRLVALTGYGQAADRQRTKAAGFHDHLVKPAELQALERALAGMVPAERRAHPRCSPVHSMPPG